MKLPNFFIVGAAKAGTTSLYKYLNQHPHVYFSPIKEPNYYCSDIDVSNFTRDYRDRLISDIDAYFKQPSLPEMHLAHITKWEHYCNLFKGVDNQTAIGEASVSYLYSISAARNIKESIPDAKIIIILRNPIERAYSHYLMDFRNGMTLLPFRKALDNDIMQKQKGWGRSYLYVELGMYYEQVKRYIDLFDKEHLRIYLYEDMNNSSTFFKDVYNYLAINDEFVPDISQRHNTARIPVSAILNYLMKGTMLRNAKRILPQSIVEFIKGVLVSDRKADVMSPSDKLFLLSLYYDDVIKLSQLIGRDLSNWLENNPNIR